VTILADWLHMAPQIDTSSARLARLLDTPPPPAPLRRLRAREAAATGRPVVRLWTGEATRG